MSAVNTYKLVVEDDAAFCDVAGSSAAIAFSDCVVGHWVELFTQDCVDRSAVLSALFLGFRWLPPKQGVTSNRDGREGS